MSARIVATALLSILCLLPAQTRVWAAEKVTAVAELFTSQGCSSCPPADALFDGISRRPGVLALSYHVDYWDYLGWHDTLATPENTLRQRGYASALKARSVYTPQLILNGGAHVNGAKPAEVDAALGAASAAGLPVPVSIARSGESIVIEAGAAATPARKAHVVIVFFAPRTEIAVSRGENAGRTLVYRNAVISVQAAGWWKGAAGRWEIPVTEFEKKGAGGAAVLLQSMKGGIPGPILGAALLDP